MALRLIRMGALACAAILYLAIGIFEWLPPWIAHAGFALAILVTTAGALRVPLRIPVSPPNALLMLSAGAVWLVCSPAIWLVPSCGALLGGTALLVLPRERPAASVWRAAAVASGTVGLLLPLQYSTLLVLESLAAAHHEVPFLAAPLAAILHGLGEVARANDGAVDIARTCGVITVRPAFEQLHLLLYAPAASGVLLVDHLWHGLTLRRVLLVLGALAAGAFASFLCALVLALHFEIVDPVLSSPLAAVLLCIVGAFLPTFARRDPPPATIAWSLSSVALGTLVAGLCVAWLGMSQPGVKKAGRLLIDETHSDWESTLVEPGTRWYGSRSGYNYFALRRFLENYFEVSVNQAPLTRSALEQHDVLVIKTPTQAYGAAEVNAILEFVAEGGSVFMIGDHTNVFGSSEYLNAIAAPLGLRFRYDSQHAFADHGLTLYVPPPQLPHPAFDPPYFLFGTGSHLEPAWWAERVVLARRNVTERADYSVRNFFFHGLGQLDRRFGSVIQVATATHGAGRALAYTDSTVFSNFWMFMPGKPEAMLDMVSWLNHRNVGPRVRVVTAVLVLLALVTFLALPTRSLAMPFAAAFALGLPIAMVGARSMNDAAYPDPRPHRTPPEVVFVSEASAYFLPRTRLIPPPDAKAGRSYVTLYGLPQRVALEPREVATIEDCLERNPRVVALLDPVQELAVASQNRLREYVNGGGRLILCGLPSESALQRIAAGFGMRLGDPTTADSMVCLLGEGRENLLPAGFEFRPIGADRILPLAGAPTGEACIAAVPVGRGLVIVVTCGALLEDSRLGADSVIPTLDQLRLHRLVYWLVRAAFDQADAEAFPPLPSMEHYFGEDPVETIKAQVQAHQDERLRDLEAAGLSGRGAGAEGQPSRSPGELPKPGNRR